MASLNDKITDTRNAARPNSTTVSAPRSTGGTTLACDNLVGWPTTSKIHFVTYQIDSSSEPIAGTQLDCYGIVSGNSIGSFAVVDGTDSGHSVGDVVEMLPTAAWGQDLADALTEEHNRDGTHKAITTDTISVSAGTTLPAGDIGTADLAPDAVTAVKLADDSVFPANLTSGLSGSTWAWQSYTPSWTNLTVGNGSVTAKYIQIGKIIKGRIYLDWGSSTSVSGSVSVSLPVTSVAVEGNGHIIGVSKLNDATQQWQGPFTHGSTTTGIIRWFTVQSTGIKESNVSNVSPATWSSTSEFFVEFEYEAA